MLGAGPWGCCVGPELIGSDMRGTISLLSWHSQDPCVGRANIAQHFEKELLQRAEVAEKGLLRACSTSEGSCGGSESGRDHFLVHYGPCMVP